MFSYQLYSSRNFPPLSRTLDMLARAGFAGVEGFGGLYADRAGLSALAEGLTANALRMRTGHFSIEQVEQTPDWVLEVAGTLGCEKVIVPWLHPDARPADGAGWRAFGQRLQCAGEPLIRAGLGFGWHNHDFEFRPDAQGVLPIAALFEGGPALEWEMDVAWVVRGGADPLHWITAEAGRITAAHVKDIAPAGENAAEDGWADVGQGVVPWATLLPKLRDLGVKHFILEHDNPADDTRFAARSLAAVKGY
jgi:sugar phosphate isomerase/epimerase